MGTLCHLARPERFELPTAWFVASCSFRYFDPNNTNLPESVVP